MRRRVTGAALALVAAGLLALRWYDDGPVRRAGLLLLTPIADRPDQVDGLGWSRFAAVLVVLVVLSAAGLALAPPPRRPDWSARFLDGTPDPAPRPPVDSGLWWTAGLTALAAAVAAVAARQLGGSATAAAAAVPVVLAGCALALPLAVRGRGRRALVAGTALAVVVALAGTLGAAWYAEGRFVTRTETGAAAPDRPGTGPAAPARVAWTREQASVDAAGGYAVVTESAGPRGPRIAVLDAATGRERWAYRHSDAYVAPLLLPEDGVLLVRRRQDAAARLLAFDLPSGRPLWTMSTGADPLTGGVGFREEEILRTPGVLLLRDGRERVVALDPRTGEQRWSRETLACLGGSAAVRIGDVVVLPGLCRSRTVAAVHVATGEPAWQAVVSDEDVYSYAPGRPPIVAGGTLVLTLVPREGSGDRLVAVDGATGRVRWTAGWRVGALPAVLAGGKVVTAETDGRALTVVARDPATGRVGWRTPLGPAGDAERATAGDAERFYLLSDPEAGGPVRVDVLDAAGRPAGGTAVTDPAVVVDRSTYVVAGGGALTVLSGRYRGAAAAIA